MNGQNAFLSMLLMNTHNNNNININSHNNNNINMNSQNNNSSINNYSSNIVSSNNNNSNSSCDPSSFGEIKASITLMQRV